MALLKAFSRSSVENAMASPSTSLATVSMKPLKPHGAAELQRPLKELKSVFCMKIFHKHLYVYNTY